MHYFRAIVVVCLVIGCVPVPRSVLRAQTPGVASNQADEMIQLNLPAAVPLNVLVDLVSERLGTRVIYDDELRNESVVIKAPSEMPSSSLLPLLQSVLKIKGFNLVDAEIDGWKRIVKAKSLTEVATPVEAGDLAKTPGMLAVTQAFTLSHVAPEQISELIKPFLTDPGANTITLPEQRTLIVTDYVSNLLRIEALVAKIDVAGPKPILEFYQVKHIEAGELESQLTKVLASSVDANSIQSLRITADPRTNQLLLTGTSEQVLRATTLAEALDVSLEMESRVYSFEYVDASRIDRLLKELLDPLTVSRLYRSSVDDNDNLLIVSAPDKIHARIAELKDQVDVEAERVGSAVKFYRLKYAKAAEALQTIFSLQQGRTAENPGEQQGQRPPSAFGTARRVQRENEFNGPNTPSAPGSAELPVPPSVQTNQEPSVPQASGVAAPLGVIPRAQVTADESSNSLIVVADRVTQTSYAELIKFLDRKRPQVMIEAKVVILDTTNSYSLGVELSGGDRIGGIRAFNFSSFGLSAVDATSGALSILPGLGYNMALVEPDVADAVLRALSTHTKARVVSAPRVLVNDNATGTLASVSEVPFTSVNASDTVATTSFAGFAEAGTTIQATPRISDDKELQLDFVVTLNSFTGTGSDGVPPPRQTNEVTSSVTIPDGYTVIVGGLNQKNEAFDQDSLPFIEKIPVLRALTSSTTKTNSQNTLFVFLRPIILRDDKFEDLKYLSDRDIPPSQVRRNFPTSQPVVVR